MGKHDRSIKRAYDSFYKHKTEKIDRIQQDMDLEHPTMFRSFN